MLLYNVCISFYVPADQSIWLILFLEGLWKTISCLQKWGIMLPLTHMNAFLSLIAAIQKKKLHAASHSNPFQSKRLLEVHPWPDLQVEEQRPPKTENSQDI